MAETWRVNEEDEQGSSVEVVPGFVFPSNGVRVVCTDHRSGLDITAGVAPSAGRLVVRWLKAQQREGGQPVTLQALRDVALSPVLKAAVSYGWIQLEAESRRGRSLTLEEAERRGAAGAVAWGLLDVEDRDRLRAQGPADETLQWVALLYRVAYAINEPPAKTVEGAFGISTRTATNWVAKAREKGFLA